MEIQQFVESKKELQSIFLSYIDDPNSDENNFQNLIDNFKIQDLFQNQNELKEFLQFITKIAKNHHRQPNFFDQIEKVLLYLENDLKKNFTNSEIFTIFKNSNPILLFLIKQKIITVDTSIVKLIRNKECLQFLYPEIKAFIDDEIERRIEESNEIDEMTKDANFDKKRRIGENETYICQLIRTDSIEEFVAFINKTNTSKNGKIKRSLFETNSFLIKKKETSLIEYAAFFGSIQIFQFLRINEVPLCESLWLYAIHSNNAEMIHILERDKVKPPNGSYERCFVEAIKCHHNEIARYIKENYIEKSMKDEKYKSCTFRYHNFEFIPINFTEDDAFFYLTFYNYQKLVDIYLNSRKNDIESQIIWKKKHYFSSSFCQKLNGIFNDLFFIIFL
ncbi:hypothetical protein M9Y10_007630 [Tritrichomonas musculus]|uniref:DUF3447 domain-containing protein n=1 Tax=Tritrichomonas musculus TaxID=1915356 RepID=A0ABR2J426_9EUKA